MRQDLTDKQIRDLCNTLDRVASGRGFITNVEAGQVRRLAGELQEHRSRQAVVHQLHEIEGQY